MRGNKLVIGILAHVDAGKTTLAEGLLYTSGQIRKLGRVDHKDAFLDNFALERERGITIFSKQAQITWEGIDITLLDTPGHVDFSAEMERTLQVLDYGLLVISGPDGVQGHVQTLWQLLRQYEIPVFLFVNKMDQPGTEKEKLLRELQEKLDGGCQELGWLAEGSGAQAQFWEELAMCDEHLLEEYLETGGLEADSLAGAIKGRHLFPCYFGSALRLEGVEELLEGIRGYALCPQYPESFGARVYKISRDESGSRLTHLKVTGGALRVKMPIGNANSAGTEAEAWEEKADQIRIYEGARFCTAEQMEAGGICAVTGLSKTFAGQGLGAEAQNRFPVLVPVLTYGLVLQEGVDAVSALGKLRSLEEEEPQLHVVWQEPGKKSSGEIQVQVMGEVQIEILKRLIAERYGMEVEFTDGRIVYKETIAGPVEGIGHFEPLRHYAEVHLLLEPGEAGSGLQFASACSEDVLDRNWQRLIITHLEEKTHLGVLTGSPITDMKITLLTGRAHIKHTEGGDFRQATYRALRQGLMQSLVQNKCVLLEPVFSFTLEVPAGQVGRAISDIQRMHGSFDISASQGEYTTLTGSAPAATMGDYQKEVVAYTKGLGRLSCTLKGYEPCHNTGEVIERYGYDPDADTDNPSASVFCAHGAGFLVNWEQVPEYAHADSGWSAVPGEGMGGEGDSLWHGEGWLGEPEENGGKGRPNGGRTASGKGNAVSVSGSSSDYITLEEIEEIFQRTYHKGKQDYEPYRYHQRHAGSTVTGKEQAAPQQATEKEQTALKQATGKEQAALQQAAGKEQAALQQAAGKEQAARQHMMGSRSGRMTLRGGNVPKDAAILPHTVDGNKEYLLVDGYNIIFAWEELRSLAGVNIDSARDKLIDVCSNYQGFMGCTLILVYDAYKVKGNPGSVQKYHNIYVVYTKEAETADQYIEKTVHKIGRKYQVTVATSDRLEQMIIWGEGAVRLSAQGFREAVEAAARQIREQYPEKGRVSNRMPIPEIPNDSSGQ